MKSAFNSLIVDLLLNHMLFSRGTFPADSKRGRICLLHDLDGDSDFEDDAIQLKLFAIAFTLLVTYNVKYYYSKVTRLYMSQLMCKVS